MEWLIIIGLAVYLFLLHGRVRSLELRVADFDWHAREPVPTEPVTAAAPLPARETPSTDAQPVEPERTPASAPKLAADEIPAISSPIDGPDEADEPIYEPEPTRRGLPKFDFEDIFGRRLPIWAGGVALAVGGIFLVRYAIEAGLLTPGVRVGLAFLFGVVLLGAAEAAFRFESRIHDPRVRQALAGAGLATLYATFYLAGARYGLIGPALSFGGLAAVTALALALTFRFGLPTAVLGLVGGFATPVMVASEQANIPVLAFYLTMLTAGLALTARRLGHGWLGSAALLAGFGWGVLMLLGGPVDTGDLLAIGLYLLALGAIVPLLGGGLGILPHSRLASGVLASFQLAALVAIAGHDLLTLGLYLLLAAALAALAWREATLRPACALAAVVGLFLLASWPEPEAGAFAAIAIGFAAVALGVPLAMIWRDRAGQLELSQLALGAPVLAAVACWHFGNADNDVFQPVLALTMAALGVLEALAALRLWRGGDLDRWLVAPLATTAGLAFAALHLLLPDWIEVAGAVLVSLAIAWLLRQRRDPAIAALLWAGGLVTLVTLLSTGESFSELPRLGGIDDFEIDRLRAALRWALAILPFLALALLERRDWRARAAEALVALVAYGLAAQLIPGDGLALVAAGAAAAALLWLPARTGGWSAMLAVSLLWALGPFGKWAVAGFEAAAAMPLLASKLPSPATMLKFVVPYTLASGFAATRLADPRIRGVLASLAAAAGLIVAHVLYKQLFALASLGNFVALGVAERTIWQALLVASGLILARWGGNRLATMGAVPVVLGFAHFALFGLLLHNPLWSEQAVGPLPMANWLLPSYVLGGFAIWWLARRDGVAELPYARTISDGLTMLLIALLALSELRQAFAGTILTGPPLSQGEDLLRSLLGIVLALGFLAWGSRRQERSWRIGSLVLMLLAVLKVFLVDAAGLEGLQRIASFLALGASLIGIGWVYSRQLSSRPKSEA